jgi:tetratricopeptide (TPR) repeat protein
MAKTKHLFRTKKQQRTTKILTGLILGGSIIGVTALVLSAPDASERVATASVEAPVVEEIAWRQDFEAPAPILEAEPEPTAEAAIDEVLPEPEPAPAVAIMHEVEGFDFEKQANEMMVDGDLRGAFTALRKHLFKNDPTPDVLLHVGQLGRQLDEFAVAEQALMDAAALDTTRGDVQTELARVRLERGEDLDGARHAAREAIRIDPRDPIAWNVAGRIAMAQSEWHRAAEAFDESLDLDPTNAIVHNNAGLNYLFMKRGPDAVDAIETAIDLYDGDAPHFVFNNLGLAYELTGAFEESREAFEEALLMNPFYARAKLNLKRIEKTIASLEAENAFETAKGITPEDIEDEIVEDEMFGEDT